MIDVRSLALHPRSVRALVTSLCLFGWLVTGVVAADAIEPPPLECPPGTDPISGHAGPRCWPRFCGRDIEPAGSIECGPGARCRDALVRWPEEPVTDWRRPGQPTVAAFEGDCACPTERCVRADVCVPDDAAVERCAGPTPPRDATPVTLPRRGGCASCAATTGSRGVLSVLVLALLGALAARRRR